MIKFRKREFVFRFTLKLKKKTLAILHEKKIKSNEICGLFVKVSI